MPPCLGIYNHCSFFVGLTSLSCLLIFEYHRERIYTPRDEDDDEKCISERRTAALRSPPGPACSLTAQNGSVHVDCNSYNLLRNASISCSKWVD